MAYQAAAQRGEHRPLFVSRRRGLSRRHARRGQRRRHRHVPRRPTGRSCCATRQIPSPHRVGTAAALEALAEPAERRGRQVCAVIIEPMVQAAGGMLTHDAAFVRGVREFSRRSRRADDRRRGGDRLRPHGRHVGGRARRAWRPTCSPAARGCPPATCRSPPCWRPRRSTTRSSVRRRVTGRSSTATPTPPTRWRAPRRLANLDLMAERETVGHAARVGERARRRCWRRCRSWTGYSRCGACGTMTGIEVASTWLAYRLRGVPAGPRARRAAASAVRRHRAHAAARDRRRGPRRAGERSPSMRHEVRRTGA